MADYDYLSIADSEMLPGRPVKTSLFFRLRNNAIAMIQGGLNAPRIEAPAFGTPAVGNKAQYYEHVCQDGLSWISAPYVLPHSYFIAEVAGTYRLIIRHNLGTASAYQIHINGAPLGTEHIFPSGSVGTTTQDFVLAAGDVITVVFRGESGGADGIIRLTIATDKPSHFPLVTKLS